MVTGLDLVRLQIEIAARRPLPLAQDAVVARGHALECRLYAEDPRKDDLPSPGRILHLAPPEGPGVRFDSGVAAGSEVTVHYDPLLAKLVTLGGDRAEAVERMAEALSRTAVLGVVTNLIRLRAILDHPAFRAGQLHTGFIEEHLHELSPEACPSPEALAALAAALHPPTRRARAATSRPVTADPWSSLGRWRLGEAG
jgi:acetyl/propionyl-CoA carboxylase alpha subunit